jgi:hypothetical protein
MGNAANRIRKWRRGLKELSAARQESEPYGLIVTDMHIPKMDVSNWLNEFDRGMNYPPRSS